MDAKTYRENVINNIKCDFLRDFATIITSAQADYIKAVKGEDAWEQYIVSELKKLGYNDTRLLNQPEKEGDSQ
jgi:hypothetical protein